MFRRREKSWLDEELERERKQSQGEVSLWSRIMDILGRMRKKPVYEFKGLTSPILQTAVYDRAFKDLEKAAREYGTAEKRRKDIEMQLARSKYGVADGFSSEELTLYADNDVLCTIIR